jgi:hypothetical protein
MALLLTLAATTLLLPRTVVSQVGQGALAGCAEFAFSTEEDFVTRGPEPPDGNPIISDGDLLGIASGATGVNCVVCARNADLLAPFDVRLDVGLDAADVVDVTAYLVAFSTELDSPNNQGTAVQFTAGDLLVTNGAIILNTALTAQWQVGYDIGLDAVHFVGPRDDILVFLARAGEYTRLNGPLDAGALADLFQSIPSIDIWFSTEGMLGPVTAPVFLDGDLLSARSGSIVAGNDLLLPPSVPAGIPNRGVDFGLDAVTNDRTVRRERIHYSTEILYEGEPSFTDGDMLQLGDGIAATNDALVQCFEPLAKDLGLDALAVNMPDQPTCENKITKIAGVDVGDISAVDGMAGPGTVGLPPILAPVPFGGWIDIEGSICDNVDEFRIVYREAGSADPWRPIPVPPELDWKVKTDAFFPPAPDCLGQVGWASHATTGWYDANDYRHHTLPALGGCNPGLALTVWESSAVPAAAGGRNALHELVLETEVGGVVYSDTARLVQLDNARVEGNLNKTAGTCNAYTGADMPLMVTGRISDTHFYRYQLRITGDGYGIHSYPRVAFYDDAGDNVVDTGTVSWSAFVDLHTVSVTDLTANPIKCGYTVLFTAWERTLASSFSFPFNQAYHCPGCWHTSDAWTFEYTP